MSRWGQGAGVERERRLGGARGSPKGVGERQRKGKGTSPGGFPRPAPHPGILAAPSRTALASSFGSAVGLSCLITASSITEVTCPPSPRREGTPKQGALWG